jgi:hypothetical protein
MQVFKLFHKIKNKPVLARWLFYLGLLAYVMPIIILPIFPSLDGAAHLYSASLLARWSEFSESQNILLQNSFPPPNILSHWLMSMLWSFMHPLHIEKLIVILCLILPIISVEWLCRLKGISSLNALLLFPLLYNFMLFLGFYNFLLGVGLVFFTYSLLTALDGKKPTTIIISSLLLGVAMHFSHLMMLPAISGLLLIDFIIAKNRTRGIALLTFIPLSLASVLSFYLIFIDRSEPMVFEWPGIITRLEMLWSSQPLVTFYETEKQTTRWFSLLILLILSVELWRIKRWNYTGRAFGIFAALILLGFLFIPENLLGGGFLSYRIQFFFLFSIIIVLMMEVRKVWQRILILGFILIYSPLQWKHQVKTFKDLTYLGKQMHEIGKELHHGGIVVPIYFSDNWLESHAANYAGLYHPVIIADFYEALNAYFPFYFNPNNHIFRLLKMDCEEGRKCPDIAYFESTYYQQVNYIFNIKKRPWPEECPLGEYLSEHFEHFKETDDVMVYKRKSLSQE